MHPDTLLIDRGPGETRVAVLAGDDVVEVHYHRHGSANAGALYRGRMGVPLPDGSAVFIDIGLDRPALMPCGSKPPAQGHLADVRVIQPPRSDKGAKVRRLKDAELEDISDVTSVQPSEVGLLKAAPHPVAWCADVYRSTLQTVIVTPHDTDGVVRSLIGACVTVDIWQDDAALFDHYGVEDAIEGALEAEVPFAGGGKLIIESTAALTAVDVDAGPMPVPQANRAAIDALARQLRLRAIAGPVIVDVIPAKGRNALVHAMKTAVADDPVSTQVSGLTPEGRLELNRRRLRPSLSELLLEPVRVHRPATDATAFRALRRCVRTGMKEKAPRVTLKAHPDVIALLQTRLRPALEEAESVLKLNLTLESAAGQAQDWFEILT